MDKSDIDVRAAVIAAAAIEAGAPQDKVVLMMTGASKRSYRKDVPLESDPISEPDDDYTVIKTPREGIYDMLPEGLFHAAALHKAQPNTRAAIEAMKQRRIEEKNARLFFLPFECELNRMYTLMALLENSLYDKAHVNDLKDIFAAQWPVLNLMDENQGGIFIHKLPFMHALRDDHHSIALFMQEIFHVPVSIFMRTQTSAPSPVPLLAGNVLLGINFTTTGSSKTGHMEIVIQAGPLGIADYKDFLPDGNAGRILSMLTDYLLPAFMHVEVDLVLENTERYSKLKDEGETYHCSLGMDTYL